MINSNSSSYMSCREFTDMAIELEQESVAFYHDLLAQAEPGATRQLLQLLKQQEARHLRTLQEWTPAEPEALIQFSPEFAANMPRAPGRPMNLSELIELAIERERISKETYRSAARTVTGDFRAMIEAFAVFEEEHEKHMKNNCVRTFILTQILIVLVIIQAVLVFRREKPETTATTTEAVVSKASQQCVFCHTMKTPAIVNQWRDSSHARSGISCAECHTAQEGEPDAEPADAEALEREECLGCWL